MRYRTYGLLKNLDRPACIVLGISTLTGLSIVRSLGIKRIPVIGIDSSKLVLGAFSKYCSSVEVVDNDKASLSLLEEIGRKSSYKNVIFCESDKYLLFLDKYKLDLKNWFMLTISLEVSLHELMNKENMLKMAREASLPVPLTYSFHDNPESKMENNIPYPSFVKPLYSQTHMRTKGEIVKDEKDLEKTLLNKRFKDGCLIQEIINGPVSNLWGYAGYRSKNIKVGITYFKYRQIPKDFGISTAVFSMSNKDVQEAGDRFLQQINYRGFFMIEFKKDIRDDRYKFIEINTRICTLNEFFVFLGFNLPYIAYLEALNVKFNNSTKQKDGILWISILDDFITCFKYYSKESKLIFIDWIRKVFKANSYAVFSLTDIKPFIFKIASHLLRINR